MLVLGLKLYLEEFGCAPNEGDVVFKHFVMLENGPVIRNFSRKFVARCILNEVLETLLGL